MRKTAADVGGGKRRGRVEKCVLTPEGRQFASQASRVSDAVLAFCSG